MTGLLFDMFIAVMFYILWENPKCVQIYNNNISPLKAWPAWIGILWKWASMLIKLAGDGECRLALFHAIGNFLANKIVIFQGYSTKLGQPLHIISPLFSPFRS